MPQHSYKQISKNCLSLKERILGCHFTDITFPCNQLSSCNRKGNFVFDCSYCYGVMLYLVYIPLLCLLYWIPTHVFGFTNFYLI